MKYNSIKIGKEYFNEKGKKRIVIDKFRNNSNIYMVTYCEDMNGNCKTCSEQWFLKWINN